MKRPFDTTIGILGGGQLARMTIAAAMRLGLRCHVLDKNADAPAALFTKYFTEGDAQDYSTVMRFAAACDAITIDSEHVNAQALVALQAQGRFVAPQGEALQIIQNKCRQKEFLQKHSFPTAKFKVFRSKDELGRAVTDYPVVQKKATHGYDGYGVKILQSPNDLKDAFDGESLVEEKINIAREIAVIVATDRAGNHQVYDPVEMVFDTSRNILKYQICPAGITAERSRHAQELAVSAATQLKICGLLAVEMFLTDSGEILINEMAPRPHNSGHHTIEAAVTSQYENLVRILAGLPLGATETTRPSLMMNILGPEPGDEASLERLYQNALLLPNAYVHNYGKKDNRPFRKLGHITLTGEREELLKNYAALQQ